MAIYGIEGKPGSGKTYYCMHHLLKKYFQFDQVLKEFFPKGNVSIVTNIDELRLNHYQLDEMVKKAGGREVFYTIEYQKKLFKDLGRIVYIIDEAGAPDKFPKKFSDDKVLFMFQYHRHLGLDFYLLAPSLFNVCDQIVRLCEYRMVSVQRSKSIGNRFRYDKYIEGDRVGITWIKKDTSVFKLYKSMTLSESEGIKSSYSQLILAFCLLIVICAGGFLFFQWRWMSGGRSASRGDIKIVKQAIASEVKPGPSVTDNAGQGSGIGKDRVGPLSETGVKGGPVQASVQVFPSPSWNQKKPDLIELKREWVKIHVSKNIEGGATVYSEDGRLFSGSDVENLLNTGVVIGKDVYIRRMEPTERVREGGKEQAGLLAGGKKLVQSVFGGH